MKRPLDHVAGAMPPYAGLPFQVQGTDDEVGGHVLLRSLEVAGTRL